MIDDPGEPATIIGETSNGTLNPDVRRAWEVEVPTGQIELVDRRLRALGDDLERHFSVRLADAESATFLRYPPGAFYLPHRDRREIPDPSNAHLRSVSVVVFVNGPHEEPRYAGGQLRFYGLLGEGPLADLGLDAEPEAGTVVAFPSTVLHEVAPVSSGVRCSIVTWFIDAG